MDDTKKVNDEQSAEEAPALGGVGGAAVGAALGAVAGPVGAAMGAVAGGLIGAATAHSANHSHSARSSTPPDSDIGSYPNVETRALQRIESEPRLSRLRDSLLHSDGSGDEAHWEWLASAPLEEIEARYSDPARR